MTGTIVQALFVPAFAIAISALLCFLLRSARLRNGFLDHPNHRSLHHIPVPRSGGLAIHAAIGMAAVSFAVLSMPLPGAGLWAGWMLVVVVSAWEDYRHVPAGVRFATHLLAAGLFLWGMDLPGWSPVAIFVAGLGLVWFVNLFNFMDGMDGFAGLMAVTGALSLAFAGIMQGDGEYALLLCAVAAASGGFLLHNLPPARLFMGDAGAVGLGFLLGALSLYGVARGLFPWPVPLLIFLPFIADATYTLITRIFRGRRPWEAHREHVYQRLVLAGRPVRKVLVIEFLIMLACQATALLLARNNL